MLELLDVLLQATVFDRSKATCIWTSLLKKVQVYLKDWFLHLKGSSKKMPSRTTLVQEVC